MQTSFARKRVTGRSGDFQFTDSNSTCYYLLFAWDTAANSYNPNTSAIQYHTGRSASTSKVCFYSCYRKSRYTCTYEYLNEFVWF